MKACRRLRKCFIWIDAGGVGSANGVGEPTHRGETAMNGAQIGNKRVEWVRGF
jgi:hypothetical protein